MPAQQIGTPCGTAEAALRLGVSVRRVRQLAAAGRFPSALVGGTLVLDLDAVEQYHANRKDPRCRLPAYRQPGAAHATE